MKSLLLVTAVASVMALGTAAPAGAATPCWKALINDWFDGKIDHTYPQWCYQQALGHLPRDVEYYSDAKDAITRAMFDAQRSHATPDYRNTSGVSGPGGSGPSGGGSEGSSKGIITRAIEWLGPSNADAVPLPLLILAAVAFLLLAAAGGSVISKRLQARRLPPPNG